MKHLLLTVYIIFSILASQAQALEQRYISHDNHVREYLIYTPSSYNPNDPAPLIFVFHGFGSSPENMQGVGLNAYAESNGYIVVYPEALVTELSSAWNCGSLLSQGIDDVGFVDKLLDELIEEFNINEKRVYACGFSLGGMMSHRLACERSNRFAAIASVGAPIATSVGNACETERKVPILYFHGTGDMVLPYLGSAIIGSASARFTLDNWADKNECINDDVFIEQVPDTANDVYHVERQTLANCDESIEVIHYKIFNWPHSWPRTGSNINATDEMVDFFERHEILEVATPTTVLQATLPKWIKIGPNPIQDHLNVSILEGYNVDEWALYSSNGQVVKNGNQIPQIDFRVLNNGLYLLVLTIEDNIYSVALVK